MDKDNEILNDQLDSDDLFDLDLGDLAMEENETGKAEDEPDDDIIELIDLVEQGGQDLEDIAAETDDSFGFDLETSDLLTESDEELESETDLELLNVDLVSEEELTPEEVPEPPSSNEEIEEIDFDQLLEEEPDQDSDLPSDESMSEDDIFESLLNEADQAEEDANDDLEELELSEEISENDFAQLLGESDDFEMAETDDGSEPDSDQSGLEETPKEETLTDVPLDEVENLFQEEPEGLSVREEGAETEILSATEDDRVIKSSEEYQMPIRPEETAFGDVSDKLDQIEIRDEEPAPYGTAPLNADTQNLVPISEEKIEEILERVVEKVVEKVARETMAEVAEKLISEAIDSLKKSLESISD